MVCGLQVDLKLLCGLNSLYYPLNTWRSFPGLCHLSLEQEDLKRMTRFTIKCSPRGPLHCMWALAPLALLCLGKWWPLLLTYPLQVHFQTKRANFQHAALHSHPPQKSSPSNTEQVENLLSFTAIMPGRAGTPNQMSLSLGEWPFSTHVV